MFDTGGGINLTPLLDIIFNLIFFFILATTIREKERYLEVNLPSASTAQQRTADEELPEVAITASGDIYLNGAPITPGELETQLAARVARDGIREVVLSTDAEVSFQRFTDITDICRAAGIQVVTPRTRTE